METEPEHQQVHLSDIYSKINDVSEKRGRSAEALKEHAKPRTKDKAEKNYAPPYPARFSKSHYHTPRNEIAIENEPIRRQ